MPQKWSKDEVKSLYVLLGRLIDEGEFSQAKAVAKQLTELDPAHPYVWYLFGRIMTSLGEPELAEKYLAKSLELDGDKLLISKQMATCSTLRCNLEDAIVWCKRALELNSVDTDVLLELADLHAHCGQPDEAIKVLNQLLQIPVLDEKEIRRARERLGRLHMTGQQFDEALEEFRKALELDSENPSLWTNIGHCLSRKGNMKEALAAFRQAVALCPNALNFYNVGDTLLSLNNPKKALPLLIEAVRKDPGFGLAHYSLSLAYFISGRYTEAAGEARAALADDPKMQTAQKNLGISATTNLGLSLMNLGKFEEALSCFERNKELISSTYFNLGLTLFKMKQFKGALKNFQRALEIKPNDPEYLDLLGQTYDCLGKFGPAEKALRRSLELDPKYALAYHDLGNLLLKLKDQRDEARRCFERSIELDPEAGWSYYSLGCYYALENKKTKALELLEKALEKGGPDKTWIESDKDLESLRDDPGFKKLMARRFAKPLS